ncbi:MAG: type II toxin-antitoxin system PemK/MazF family toxin [Verrucomicrobia bacterium]|nr:type II toxin-antitoxin system PemK/MazF family toxin [Verrucomicrobiota bacterium]
MARPSPHEVWQLDLGQAAKVRPALVMSDFPAADELGLVVVIPHTTAIRGNRWEFVCPKPFLRSGAFHLQQIQPVSLPRLERKLGELTPAEFSALGTQLAELLHLTESRF